ncbi:MAG TPA: FAD-dependent oxidoreductase [Nitrosomonas europaea]|uniref:FAD-dependent oxidoreductase n=1 Tax=Nitrosomonas europaea TaxID=915 RepID=UPI002B8E7CBF|nr:FAD-dependent oxidoreductase [Nitrosomonas europaea]HRO56427.1 FAD-dependent oxidoreductase [Nitrosomonas europaea]HRQ08852.1 FAD-dependent oxidoreductase [Nitrosomonas europaea]HUM74474.1 FAD-dependent oxidoreductase [Nitrosomonas europaea]
MPTTRHYDIVIIGGGIQGAAVAQAAAALGYNVLVLEKTALAAGTSSRSSKLVHGGLRYLESGQFGLVWESLKERAALLHLAPSLVRLQPFHIPIYDQTSRDTLTIRAGLSLYALLAGLSKGAGFHSIPRRRWGELDGLSTRGLRHVFQYWDAQTDDQALTRAIMHSASSLGVELHCPAEFIHARISGEICEIEFLENNQTYQCTASSLVNAAGPWVSQVAERISPAPPAYPVELVQGTHLILEGSLDKGCYYLESPQDRRAIFALPWKQHILLGTTETVFEGAPDKALPLVSEENYLLGCFRYYFPDHGATVRERFTGLRVLPVSRNNPFGRSRETHLQCDSPESPRIVGIYGGKLTVCRATARKVLHTLRPSLPVRIPKADISQLTLKLP